MRGTSSREMLLTGRSDWCFKGGLVWAQCQVRVWSWFLERD